MNIRYSVLYADDEPDCLKTARLCFQAAGHSIFTVRSGREALLAAHDEEPDIVISDVRMPGMDGYELSRQLKAGPKTARIPIVLLSGVNTAADDQLAGYDSGVDDYLLKPCRPDLLVAKAMSVLRRYATAAEIKKIFSAEGLSLKAETRTIIDRGAAVALTRKEFDLMITLMRKRGRTLSARFLLESVWGYDPADYNNHSTVATHLSTLRRKLSPGLRRRIVTVTGSGYRFEP